MNSKLHVLMLVPQFPYPVVGGLEHQALKLSRALVDRGVDVTALSGKVVPDQLGYEVTDGIKVIRIDWQPQHPGHYRRTAGALLAEMIRLRRSIDIVHVHQNSWYGLFGIIVSRFLGKPVLTKLPNVGAYGIPGLLTGQTGALRLGCLRASNGIVAMSEESIDELANINFPKRRTLAVPNGVLMTRRDFPVRENREKVIFSFIGRLEPQKNLPVLLQAWRQAQSSMNGRSHLNIWGRGSLDFELRSLCSEYNIIDTVTFRGYCEDVPAALINSDVLVQPSVAEGNSNTLLEAMSLGLPIIATKVGGTEMQVGAAGLRFLSEPGDVATISEHLQMLAESYDLRRSVGYQMFSRVEELFDIRRVAEVYEASYRQLIAQRHPDLFSLSYLPKLQSNWQKVSA
jgi:glycosyltransferase involved in cell wall biosynthesis